MLNNPRHDSTEDVVITILLQHFDDVHKELVLAG